MMPLGNTHAGFECAGCLEMVSFPDWWAGETFPGASPMVSRWCGQSSSRDPQLLELSANKCSSTPFIGADVPIADVIGHDDEDVWFLLLLCGRWRRCHHHGREQCEQAKPDALVDA